MMIHGRQNHEKRFRSNSKSTTVVLPFASPAKTTGSVGEGGAAPAESAVSVVIGGRSIANNGGGSSSSRIVLTEEKRGQAVVGTASRFAATSFGISQ